MCVRVLDVCIPCALSSNEGRRIINSLIIIIIITLCMLKLSLRVDILEKILCFRVFLKFKGQ